MSTTPPQVPEAPKPPTGGLPPAVQQRLQKVFDRAKQCLERGDYAYAHDLFAQCVAEAPGSIAFLQHFRANLAQMHPPGAPTKSGRIPSLGSFGGGRSAVAKAAGKGAWQDAFTAACEALKRNPRDTGVLSEMASACGELGHSDCQLFCLRWALDIAPKDLEINRLAAAVLEEIDEYDQAIGCWLRVQQQKPGDEEAARAISRLSVEKTIDRGGYNPQLLKGAGEVSLPTPARVAVASARVADNENVLDDDDPAAEVEEVDEELTEEQLRDAVDKAPRDPATYSRLAELCIKRGQLYDAERLLRRALKFTQGVDVELLVKLEDVHLQRMRERALDAERKALKNGGASLQKIAEQTLRESNLAEVEVYTARVARTPEDAKLQWELGLRLKRVGRHRDAIQPFQAARADRRRIAEIELHLGECFQHIEQHGLAMRSYQASVAACPPNEWTDLRKLALYRAGVLAMGMKDLDHAEAYLTDLASADFGYRDVSERLDKIAEIRKNA